MAVLSLENRHTRRLAARPSRSRLSYHLYQMLLNVRLENRTGPSLFWSRMLRQDQVLQFPVRASKLQIETHSYGTEDSHAAQCNYREAAALERRVDVGLEVEIVLIILIHPDPKIGDNKRLYKQQGLDRTRNIPSRTLDMIARAHSPGDQKISASTPRSSSYPVR